MPADTGRGISYGNGMDKIQEWNKNSGILWNARNTLLQQESSYFCSASLLCKCFQTSKGMNDCKRQRLLWCFLLHVRPLDFKTLGIMTVSCSVDARLVLLARIVWFLVSFLSFTFVFYCLFFCFVVFKWKQWIRISKNKETGSTKMLKGSELNFWLIRNGWGRRKSKQSLQKINALHILPCKW